MMSVQCNQHNVGFEPAEFRVGIGEVLVVGSEVPLADFNAESAAQGRHANRRD